MSGGGGSGTGGTFVRADCSVKPPRRSVAQGLSVIFVSVFIASCKSKRNFWLTNSWCSPRLRNISASRTRSSSLKLATCSWDSNVEMRCLRSMFSHRSVSNARCKAASPLLIASKAFTRASSSRTCARAFTKWSRAEAPSRTASRNSARTPDNSDSLASKDFCACWLATRERLASSRASRMSRRALANSASFVWSSPRCAERRARLQLNASCSSCRRRASSASFACSSS
mmetsp:Transcript_40068/g.113439  ORF Transcript_40068/g.113439 Transcript_40068/m.113439 type:complete len:229 (+) Transcript_40068:121-807(+)